MIKSRRMGWAGLVVLMKKRNVYRISVRQPGGMWPVGRSRREWCDNISTDIRDIRGDMDWIYLAQDRDQ
jgi:hypothetical protein